MNFKALKFMAVIFFLPLLSFATMDRTVASVLKEYNKEYLVKIDSKYHRTGIKKFTHRGNHMKFKINNQAFHIQYLISDGKPSFKLNGHQITFEQAKDAKKLDKKLRQIFKAQKKKVSLINFFIPEAQAFFSLSSSFFNFATPLFGGIMNYFITKNFVNKALTAAPIGGTGSGVEDSFIVPKSNSRGGVIAN